MSLLVTSGRVRRAVFGAIVLVAVVLALVGLDVVGQSLRSGMVSAGLLLTLLPFAAWSYGLRTYRWHILVRSVIPGVSPRLSCYAQVIGFAFSVSPGRIAELYKLRLLERGTGTSIAQSLPVVVVERLTDAVVLGTLVVLGGMLHLSAEAHSEAVSPLVVGTSALIVLAIVFGRRRRTFGWRPERWLDEALRRTSLGRRVVRFLATGPVATALSQLKTGGSRVTRPETIGLALAFVLLARLGDGIILWKISSAIGYPVAFPLALTMIGAAGLFGGASFSPGGIGAAEAALVGMITANGMPLGMAIVAAFTTRALLFWIWVLLGLGTFAVSHGFPIVKSAIGGYLGGGRRPEPAPQHLPR